jgi:hypothetical protein
MCNAEEHPRRVWHVTIQDEKLSKVAYRTFYSSLNLFQGYLSAAGVLRSMSKYQFSIGVPVECLILHGGQRKSAVL